MLNTFALKYAIIYVGLSNKYLKATAALSRRKREVTMDNLERELAALAAKNCCDIIAMWQLLNKAVVADSPLVLTLTDCSSGQQASMCLDHADCIAVFDDALQAMQQINGADGAIKQ